MMFSLSTFARRSAMTMAPTTRAAVAVRPLGTQTLAQVNDLETMLQNKHWNYSKDTVKEIRELMNENKTNHAVHCPDAVLEDQVCTRMKDIQEMIRTDTANREQVQAQIWGLKKIVKANLYKKTHA